MWRRYVLAAGIVAVTAPGEAGAQDADRLAYVVERPTLRAADSVMRCLESEIRRNQPGRIEYTVVKVTQSTATGSGGTMRGPGETRNPPPRDVNSYGARVVRVDDRVVAQVTARTTRMEFTEAQTRQRSVRPSAEAKRVADRMLARCAPGPAEQPAETAEDGDDES
jgi:hypothetical protein